MAYIFQDWKVNSEDKKGRLVLFFFRIASIGARNKFLYILLIPYQIFYKVFVEWILGVEIPYKTKIGSRLIIYHGQSLVVNPGTIIGDDCTLRQSTTIGNKQLFDGNYSIAPIIGNNVDIGSNVCIIGPIIIGNNVKIGAGSVVVKDVPTNCIVAGNPAKIIRYLI